MRATILDVIKHKTVEVGDCLEWTGYVTKDYGYPFTSICGRGILVKRLVAMRMGIDIDRFTITNTCGNKLCVNPDHIKACTRRVLAKSCAQKMNANPVGQRKRIINNRAKGKLSMEIANQIRAEVGMTKRSLAQKYGVDDNVISRILAGKSWADMTSPMSQMAAILG